MAGTPKRAILHLNSAELLRRKQALIRQGQKLAFTGTVKPLAKNTPEGRSRPSAHYVKRFDGKQKYLEETVRMRDEDNRRRAQYTFPKDVLLAHAVHITRGKLALRQDRLIRAIPTIEKPAPKREIRYPRPTDWTTEYEKKLWRELPESLKAWTIAQRIKGK